MLSSCIARPRLPVSFMCPSKYACTHTHTQQVLGLDYQLNSYCSTINNNNINMQINSCTILEPESEKLMVLDSK